MRRPPDKDGHPTLSERDVDSSNATLNTLFGGTPKKSWMIGSGGPVRPTPRTSISKPLASPQIASLQRNTFAVVPSPAPNDEQSPSTPPNGSSRSTSNPVSDGGARQPLADMMCAPGDTNLSLSEGGLVTAEGEATIHNTIPSKRPYTELRKPANPNLATEIQPSTPVIDIPPLPSSVMLPSDHPQTSQGAPTPTTRNFPHSHYQPQSFQRSLPTPSSRQASPNFGAPAPPVPNMQQNTSNLRLLQGSRDQLASPVLGHNFSPRISSSSVINEPQSYPITTVFPANPHKKQRTQQAAMPSLRPRTILIEAYIDSLGGRGNLNPGLERPRFQLLTQACNEEDPFYVALHQLFCVWDINPSEVAQIPLFPSIAVLNMAFKVLGQLIRSNDQLHPDHQSWFAMFPSPLSDLLRTSEPYRVTVGQVGVFLDRLATDWIPLSKEASLRKYPPLVDELVGRLGLLSPILQGVVFTAARRNIDVAEGEFANQMEAIFRKDQKEHQALAIRYNTARPPTAKEAQDRNARLKNEYLKTYSQFMGQRLASSPTLVNSSATRFTENTVASNGHLITSSQQQYSHNPNMAENPSNRQLPAQQQPQLIQQQLARPSNPNTAQRPQSVGSQRVHPTALSPGLFQGLTVNSPVQQGFELPSNSTQQQQQQHPQQQQQQQFQNISYNPAAYGAHYQLPSQMFSPSQVLGPQMPQISLQQNQNWMQQQRHQFAMQNFQGQPQVNVQQQQNIPIHLQQQVLNQGIASLNRTTLRRASNTPVGAQQAPHSRTNSASSGAQRTPVMAVNTIPGTARPLGALAGIRSEPSTSYDQVPHADIAKYNASHPLQRPFIPPLGYVQPPQATNPDYTALHQAHLRSPRLVPIDKPLTNKSQDDPSCRYYQVVKHFALSPAKVHSSVPLSKFEFLVPVADLAKTPNDHPQNIGQVAVRQFRCGTLQYRLRCIQMKKNESKCSISEWVVRDTIWPESTSLKMNDRHLEIRRKNHHGKDLPIDVTSIITGAGPDSTHQISMSVLRGRGKMRDFTYFVGVDVVEILGHQDILDMCQKNHVPANQTLDNIKKSLAGPADGDDDFAMVVSDLAIDLADPFTARIFETPVRGSACLHRECFDLKTFLLTRNSKPKRPEQPCMVDVWKCPLCGKDARPYSLQVDDFLASVRTTLEAQGKLDVKAIWIAPDGKWRPKIEERTGVADPNDSEDSSDDELAMRKKNFREAMQSNKSKKVIEVIDLDGD